MMLMMMGRGRVGAGGEYWPDDVVASLSTPHPRTTSKKEGGEGGGGAGGEGAGGAVGEGGEGGEGAGGRVKRRRDHERPDFIHENQLYADSWPPLTQPPLTLSGPPHNPTHFYQKRKYPRPEKIPSCTVGHQNGHFLGGPFPTIF